MGVDIPSEKRTLYSLQYLYGVGPRIGRIRAEGGRELRHQRCVAPWPALRLRDRRGGHDPVLGHPAAERGQVRGSVGCAVLADDPVGHDYIVL